jgi:hypothetical protein
MQHELEMDYAIRVGPGWLGKFCYFVISTQDNECPSQELVQTLTKCNILYPFLQKRSTVISDHVVKADRLCPVSNQCIDVGLNHQWGPHEVSCRPGTYVPRNQQRDAVSQGALKVPLIKHRYVIGLQATPFPLVLGSAGSVSISVSAACRCCPRRNGRGASTWQGMRRKTGLPNFMLQAIGHTMGF